MKIDTYEKVGGLLIILSLVMMFLTVTYRWDKDINILQEQILDQQLYIDSLKHEIDTLEWNNQIWDFNIKMSSTHLLSAIMFVESSNNDSAYHKGEDAVGCLQIRKCMVDDVNRILKRQRSRLQFYYEDRWDRSKSIQIFDIYCKHYNLSTPEEMARCWNGGPRGMTNEMTVGYWKKVKKNLDS
ncbi:MAG: hypothetical protein H8E55_21265 [Pelagibacterales bacterium]|nr:hypothetical protein [Pelagibacterales bacterium]